MATEAIRNNLRSSGQLHEASNAGLWLDCYLDYAAEKKCPEFREAQDKLYGGTNAAIDRALPLYRLAIERWQATLPAEATKSEILAVDGRLIVGLGGENVLETGLLLHHVYGVPIIPGTALKGLASHFCEQAWGKAEGGNAFCRAGQNHDVLFGRHDEGGLIQFHDAWFDPDSLADSTGVQADVMTPHHGDYYGESGKHAPTDFDDPVPVHFLSVAGRFFVAVTSHVPTNTYQWAELAMTLLLEALDRWGVGGKTNSGYGRLVPANEIKETVIVTADSIPSQGDIVEVTLVEQNRKKTWKARHEPSTLEGPITASADMAGEPGATRKVQVVTVNAANRQITFRQPKS